MEIKKSMHCFSGINCVREERLGFQDLQNFNIVLLVKQLWKVIDKPEPLFVNAFKEKNYRKSVPLYPIKFYSPSIRWRSITSA